MFPFAVAVMALTFDTQYVAPGLLLGISASCNFEAFVSSLGNYR